MVLPANKTGNTTSKKAVATTIMPDRVSDAKMTMKANGTRSSAKREASMKEQEQEQIVDKLDSNKKQSSDDAKAGPAATEHDVKSTAPEPTTDSDDDDYSEDDDENHPTFFLNETLYSAARGWHTVNMRDLALELQDGSSVRLDGEISKSASDCHLTVAEREAIMAKAAADGEPDVVLPAYEPPGPSRCGKKRTTQRRRL